MSAGGQIRAVVVGAGLMGAWHADAIRKLGATVAWAVDADPVRARQLAAPHGAQWATDLQEALASGGCDVVHVCTPLATHAPLARQALTSGAHVLVEKPLAMTPAATADLLDVAAAQHRVLCPVHQFLFQPGVQYVFDRLAQLGPLLHVDAVACSAGAVGPFAVDPDTLIPEIIPHPLALLARLFPDCLGEADWRCARPRPGELRAQAVLGSASVGLLVSSRGRPTANSFRLIGEHGTAHLDLFHGFAVVERGNVSRTDKILHPFRFAAQTLVSAGANLGSRVARREPAYPGLRELIARFYLAVRGEAPPPLRPAEILDVARAREQLAFTRRSEQAHPSRR